MSTSASLSWVVYRPAVSSSTASSVNHQSQWRVPPMPPMAVAPWVSLSGNCRPEWVNAVVLPLPGAPTNRYHGNWYRYCPPGFQPGLALRSTAIASRMRSARCATSACEARAEAGSPACSSVTPAISRRLARQAAKARQPK